jgi:hypothetical protein
MEALEAMLDAGHTPLADILALEPRLGTMHQNHVLPSAVHPGVRHIMFRVETGRTSSDYLYRVRWMRDGVCGRDGDDLPAEVLFTGILGRPVEKMWFNSAGMRHREGDKPSVVTWERLEWHTNGKQHRDGDRPALHTRILLFGDRSRRLEWYQDGVLHRDGGRPAVAESWAEDSEHQYVEEYHVRGHPERWAPQTIPVPVQEWAGDNVHFKRELDVEVSPW